MKTNLRATLETHIENFLEEIMESKDRCEALWPDCLAHNMAKAASAVYDCSCESSIYTKENS